MSILMSVLLMLAGVGFLILIHVCIVARRFLIALATNEATINARAERGSLASSTMSREDIEKLPSYRYKDDIVSFVSNNKEERMRRNIIGNQKECAVCLENLKVGDKCRLLPYCKHSFHADCVDVWLLKSTRCPICRTSAESSNREINFDEEEIIVFQSDGIIVEEVEDSQEIVIPIELSEIQEVEDGHQHQSEIEMKDEEPREYRNSDESSMTGSKELENQANMLERT